MLRLWEDDEYSSDLTAKAITMLMSAIDYCPLQDTWNEDPALQACHVSTRQRDNETKFISPMANVAIERGKHTMKKIIIARHGDVACLLFNSWMQEGRLWSRRFCVVV